MCQISLSEATHRNIQALNQAQRASLLPIVQQVLHYRDLVARQGWLVLEVAHQPFVEPVLSQAAQSYCDKVIELLLWGHDASAVAQVCQRGLLNQPFSALEQLALLLFSDGMLALSEGRPRDYLRDIMLASLGFQWQAALEEAEQAREREYPLAPLVWQPFTEAELQQELENHAASDWINLLWLVQSEPLWQRLSDNLTQRTQRHFHESYQHHWQGVRRRQPLAAYWREAYQSFTNLYQLLHVQLGDEAMARLLGITESEAPNGNDSDSNGH
ncbi:hypothetical protein RI534_16185 [Aeromonas allosaccharophila]|uniref:hypothetical protein n=1 Tax=Aeromonas allosaccharophila TaxID=656 RepID=UPI003434EE20